MFPRVLQKLFLIDALNESKNYQAVITSLARLFEKSTIHVYIMLTSIDEFIDEDLERFPIKAGIRTTLIFGAHGM